MLKVQEHKAANAALLRMLSPVYAGRGGLLTAALQYVYQTVRMGPHDVALARKFEAFAGEKLRDFEELGSLLVSLGADPVFTACPPYPVSYHSCAGVDYAADPAAMIEADIRLETALLEQFEKIAAAAAEERVLRWKAHAQKNLAALGEMRALIP